MTTPEKPQPFLVAVGGKQVGLVPENVNIALFWETTKAGDDLDYIDIHSPDKKDPQGPEAHTICFQPELARWIGGFALRPEDQKELRLAERTNGSFFSKAGWRSIVMVEQRPNAYEEEFFVQHLMAHSLDTDEHLHKDLEAALKAEFDGS